MSHGSVRSKYDSWFSVGNYESLVDSNQHSLKLITTIIVFNNATHLLILYFNIYLIVAI